MKSFWVILITVVLSGAVVGGGVYYYEGLQAKTQKDDLNSQITALQARQSALEKQIADAAATTTTTPTTTGVDTSGWNTYTNSTSTFSLKYPKTYNLISKNGTASDTKVNLRIDEENITTVSDADGACGSASKALYAAQSTAFKAAKVGDSFDTAYGKTDFKMYLTKIVTNAAGINFARGFSLCRGITEATDPVSYEYRALTFSGNNRIVIVVYLPTSLSNVQAQNLSAQVSLIDKGTQTGQGQTEYNNFKAIVDSFKLL